MNGYVCFYHGKKVEVLAKSSYSAQLKVAEMLKVPAKRWHEITVVLAEKGGEQVVHLPLF